MEKLVTKEESWVLSDYEEAFISIMNDQEKHRKKLEAMIRDYYLENESCFLFPHLNTYLLLTSNIGEIIKMESVFQLARIIGSKLKIDSSVSLLAFSYHTIESMYGGSAICKHRNDYTLWVDFLVGWYFNRVTQLEVDNNESVRVTK